MLLFVLLYYAILLLTLRWHKFVSGKQSPGSSCGSANLPLNDAHSSCSPNMKTKLTVPPVSLSPPILTKDQVLPGNCHGFLSLIARSKVHTCPMSNSTTNMHG